MGRRCGRRACGGGLRRLRPRWEVWPRLLRAWLCWRRRCQALLPVGHRGSGSDRAKTAGSCVEAGPRRGGRSAAAASEGARKLQANGPSLERVRALQPEALAGPANRQQNLVSVRCGRSGGYRGEGLSLEISKAISTTTELGADTNRFCCKFLRLQETCANGGSAAALTAKGVLLTKNQQAI